MDEEEEPQGKKKAGSDSTVLLLGLYLLLLAFFIVLNTISTTDELKSDVVQSSLTSTFSTLLEPRVREAFTSQVGAVVEAQEFHTEVTDLFASAIPAVKVRIIEPGQLLTVSFHSDSLFFPDTTDFRPARLDLLDRLTATLSAKPAGYAYEMEFLIGVAPEDDGTLPVEPGLSMRRAAAFAALARDRGMPPEGLAVGLTEGEPKRIVMYFRTQRRDGAEPVTGVSAGQGED